MSGKRFLPEIVACISSNTFAGEWTFESTASNRIPRTTDCFLSLFFRFTSTRLHFSQSVSCPALLLLLLTRPFRLSGVSRRFIDSGRYWFLLNLQPIGIDQASSPRALV